MQLTKKHSYEAWLRIVDKQLQRLYDIEVDAFEDVYDLRKAYDDNKQTRLVVEELALLFK